MENRIRNVKKAAAILSSFDFKGTSDCHVIAYFATSCGVIGVGKNCYCALPKDMGYLPTDDGAFKTWKKKEWESFILEGAKPIRQMGIKCVVSIWISFSTEKPDELVHSLFWRVYTIEVTDLKHGRFDRMLASRTSHPWETMLSEPESARIRGACDVVKLSTNIPAIRWQKAPNEYAKFVNDHEDPDNAFMCHTDI